MLLIIIFFSILITVFVFLFAYAIPFIAKSRLRSIIVGSQSDLGIVFDKSSAENKNKRRQSVFGMRTGWASDLNVFFEQPQKIKIFGINITSIESLFLARIVAAVSFTALIVFFGFVIKKNFLIYGITVGIILYFLPLAVLKSRIDLKAKKILKELPDFIDILASLIKAGLTFTDSILYIMKNYNSEISSLFSIYHNKILEGFSKKEAFDTIGRFSFCSEFKSLVKILYQSEVVGNPIKDVLRDLSRVYRNNQRDFLKMKAQRLESNLIIVVFVFIFIPMLLLFLIPVLPQIKFLLG